MANSDEVVNNSSVKPHLEERGPYVFDQWIDKVNIKYKNDDQIVTYDNKKTYIFNKKQSKQESKGLNLDDQVIVINVPYLVC